MPAFNKPTIPRKRYVVITFCLLLFFPVISAFTWPLDTFEAVIAAPGNPEDGRVIVQQDILLGQDIENMIIHSVQRTPVIDTYRAQEGRIWAWREKIQSHNAGLPSLKPERGRFLYDAPWMIVEGGGASWETIHYRVGTEELGKNELSVFGKPAIQLWREVPGKRLTLRVVRASRAFLP